MDNFIVKLNESKSFNYAETFELYNQCARTLVLEEPTGLNRLIYLLNNREKFDKNLDAMLADLVEAAGFYPYLQLERLAVTSTDGSIRMANNASNFVAERVFHDEQKRVLDKLRAGQNLVVSAPTSFGKSLLIEEMVASYQHKNILIIQPTLALLDETRIKLAKYRDKYKFVLRTSQTPDSQRGNIFLLTAERVNEYREFPTIDFLVVDEFYKLSAQRGDERSDSLNNALFFILRRFSPQFYLAGPNIDSVSKEFLNRYNAEFFSTTYNLVGAEEIDIFSEYPNSFGDRGKKKEFKEKILFELLRAHSDEQTIVYCASPNRARSLARSYLQFIKQAEAVPLNPALPVYQWISENVSPIWSLIELMQYGIGFHDGALQRHITSTIVEYFDRRTLNVLFCTATIIEGVNTNAKNIVYFDQRKGKDIQIDYFDYSNIRGRAGRMMEHYVGRVFNFGAPPKKNNVDIDIPFVDQAPLADEILINLSPDEVKDKSSDQFRFIQQLPTAEREVFSENGLYIRGQVNLLQLLRDRIDSDYSLICWDRLPTYAQLDYAMDLAWTCLRRPDENFAPMTQKWITNLTFGYGVTQSINGIVKDRFAYSRDDERNARKSDSILMDDAIRDAFQIMRHWFQYKIPKWLLVIDRLQRFVCEERGIRAGSYIYYAAVLENDFVRENMSILAEFGVPRSAIVKLSQYIKPELDQDEVLLEIHRRQLMRVTQLTDYEKEKVKGALGL